MFLEVELLDQRKNIWNIFVDSAVLPPRYESSCFLRLSNLNLWPFVGWKMISLCVCVSQKIRFPTFISDFVSCDHTACVFLACFPNSLLGIFFVIWGPLYRVRKLDLHRCYKYIFIYTVCSSSFNFINVCLYRSVSNVFLFLYDFWKLMSYRVNFTYKKITFFPAVS